MDIFPQDLMSTLRVLQVHGNTATWNINRDGSGLTVSIQWNSHHTRTESGVCTAYPQLYRPGNIRKPPSTVRRDRQRMKNFMDIMDRKNAKLSPEIAESVDYVNQKQTDNWQIKHKVSTSIQTDSFEKTAKTEQSIQTDNLQIENKVSTYVQTVDFEFVKLSDQSTQTAEICQESVAIQLDAFPQSSLSTVTTQTDAITVNAISVQTTFVESAKSDTIQTDAKVFKEEPFNRVNNYKQDYPVTGRDNSRYNGPTKDNRNKSRNQPVTGRESERLGKCDYVLNTRNGRYAYVEGFTDTRRGRLYDITYCDDTEDLEQGVPLSVLRPMNYNNYN